MSQSASVQRIPVGVVVERRPAKSPWIDFVWRPISVLPGVPDTAPWTVLSEEPDRTTFYAGSAEIELYVSDTGQYRDNLQSETPSVWIVLRPTGGDPPYSVFTVTANPSEGEVMTETGSDLVEAVPMPSSVMETVAAFVALYHVERVFFKRKRQEADPEALARRPMVSEDKSRRNPGERK